MSSPKTYAVAAVMRGRKVLIARRANTKSFLPGRFELPGGLVEQGETPEECVRRELLEELGIEIRVIRCVLEFGFDDASGSPAREKVFWAEIEPSSPEPVPKPAEHSEIVWINHSELSVFFGGPGQEPEGDALRLIFLL